MRTLSETGWFTSGFFVVTYFQTKPLRLLFVSTSWSFEGGHRRLVLAGGWPAPGASAGGAKGVEYHRISWDISRYLKMSQDTSKEHPTEVQEFQCLHPTLVKWVRVPRLAPPFLSSVRTALFLVAKVDHAVIRHCHLHVGFQWISQVQDGSGWYRYP
jgi:hypothetical protein